MQNVFTQYLQQHNIDPRSGLGKELFLFVSSLTPIVNVDLLVYNKQGQFLLTRRDDPYCGRGWHVPGGCIRFKESSEERVRLVAKNELGITHISFDQTPIKIFEIIDNRHRPIANQNERAHFITLVYKCRVDSSYLINNGELKEDDVGFIKWFDKLPEDLISIQNCYRQILK